MKHLYSILLVLFGLINLQAQTIPQGINYQAVARNSQGKAIISQKIVVEISILSDTLSQNTVWQEIHQVETNAFGQFQIIIGEGISTTKGTSNRFDAINWGAGPYFLKVRADIGSESFINGMNELNTVSLQSVPYALISDSTLHAPTPTLTEVLGLLPNDLQNGDIIIWDDNQWQNSQNYLKADGSSDLSGNWIISENSISFTEGSLFLTHGGMLIKEGNLFVPKGTIVGDSIRLWGGTAVNYISNGAPEEFEDSPENASRIATMSAISSYVQSKIANDGDWTINGNRMYNNSAQRIGIGTNIPEDQLHAELGTAGFLLTGEFNPTESNIKSGEGARFSFYPARGSLRAGVLDTDAGDAVFGATYWNTTEMGNYSSALGRNTKAKGDYTFVWGRSSIASGLYALAGGHQNTASGNASIALGDNTSASGHYATALGQNTSSEGANSFALGYYSTAQSFGEVVIGRYNRLAASPSTTNWQNNDALLVVANGLSDGSRSNALTVWKDGLVSIGDNSRADFTGNIQLVVKGDVKANGVTLSSDRRLKYDIQPIGAATSNQLLKLNGVRFKWRNTNDQQTHLGLLAQDVEAYFPELVSTDSKGMKSVDYIGLIPLMLETIKTQETKILTAEKQLQKQSMTINAMKSQQEQLEKRLEALEKKLSEN